MAVDYTKYNTSTGVQSQEQIDAGLRAHMIRIFNYMAVALTITGAIAYFASQSQTFLQQMFDYRTGQPTTLFMIVAFCPLVPWLGYFFGLHRKSVTMANVIFWGYATCMGLSMFSIFLVYTNASIARAFFISAAVFAGMSFFGYTTKRDLTKMGSFLIMAMWAVFLSSIVNMIFFKSSTFDLISSAVWGLVFVGLTAYGVQAFKNMYHHVAGDKKAEKIASFEGALFLYITFINIFMTILRLMGDRR